MEKMDKRALNPLIVALDVADAAAAFKLIEKLNDPHLFVKVGMRLFYKEGPTFVRQLVEQGIDVFLDLKLHDIPNTVLDGAHVLASLGVRMMTVHCAGGLAMLEAARRGVEKACPGEDAPLLVGVTQLTSTSQQVMNEEIGLPGSVQDAVLRYAQLAKRAGLAGVVSSVWEVPTIKEKCGRNFLAVTPGIRPLGADRDDQKRISTPQKARRLGSDFLVVGRPIIQAQDPYEAYQSIKKEITKAGNER